MTPDVFTQEKRSEVMQKIRSYDTTWEVAFRRRLWRRGLRYRVHYGPRKIDVAFPRENVAVFLDSCFWHYCPEHRELPKSNREFWREKLEGNYERDRRVTAELQADGWTVLRLWSHEFVNEPEAAVAKVFEALGCG
jgi:DNA mismatch endonuclease (patch repair protein)